MRSSGQAGEHRCRIGITIPLVNLLLAVLDRLSRYVAAFGGVVFLLGQAFAGALSLAGMLGAVGGLAAAALASVQLRPRLDTLLLAGCMVGLCGAALHVYEYYSTPHSPGNYYPWFITAPFALALSFLAVRAAMRRPGAAAAHRRP
jgi:drug/metabolite transporter (DMT)-like permease